MKVGDLLEWIAAAAFVVAGYLWLHSIALALAILGVCLVYFGQCLASTELPRLRRPQIVQFVKAAWKRKVRHNAPSRPR